MQASRRRPFSFPLLALVPTIGFLGAGACGVDGANVPLPYFEGGVEGGTIEGDAEGGSNDGAPSDGQVNETGTDAADDSGDASGGASSLVLSQVQSRGTGGGNDEFIEIYNASAASITFDNTWSVTVRNATGGVATCATALPSTLFSGTNQVIASHKHLLFATSSYSESGTAAADTTYSAGIPDAASLVLVHSGVAVDALCFEYDGATTTTLTTCLTAYTCEGTPALNPHDNTTGTDTEASLERKPGGAGGNGTDVGNNSTDFQANNTPDPHDLASLAVP